MIPGPTPSEVARVRWLIADAVRVIRAGGKTADANALYRLDEAASVMAYGDGWRDAVVPEHYANSDFPP